MLKDIKSLVRRTPLIGPAASAVWALLHPQRPFPGSAAYWEQRYKDGGNSGAGSYNRLAHFKAAMINDFVSTNNVEDVIEYGCGDGNQLTLANYKRYTGFDVSDAALNKCRQTFKGDGTKSFRKFDDYKGETADLSMSLDVVYHLVEDAVFDLYMRRLFSSSRRFVLIYSSNDEALNLRKGANHVRHRKFTDLVGSNTQAWTLITYLPNEFPYDESDPDNTSFADFYIFAKAIPSKAPAREVDNSTTSLGHPCRR